MFSSGFSFYIYALPTWRKVAPLFILTKIAHETSNVLNNMRVQQYENDAINEILCSSCNACPFSRWQSHHFQFFLLFFTLQKTLHLFKIGGSRMPVSHQPLRLKMRLNIVHVDLLICYLVGVSGRGFRNENDPQRDYPLGIRGTLDTSDQTTCYLSSGSTKIQRKKKYSLFASWIIS